MNLNEWEIAKQIKEKQRKYCFKCNETNKMNNKS